MKTLLLEPNNTAQWYALITEAESKCAFQLSEDLESYLVFLMMRFMMKPEIAINIIALEFLHSIDSVGAIQNDKLRDVGDKCLIFAGLFPGLARKRHVDDHYFSHLGQSAYLVLADISLRQTAKLYQAVGEHFLILRDILKAIRPNVQSSLADHKDLFHKTLAMDLNIGKRILH